ncbi:MAG TPA: hypothetical protein VKY85_10645 [Candidatus Angelobacter sp.]|nr:hypothetical protein [Candidatus Angelobacter sp.]
MILTAFFAVTLIHPFSFVNPINTGEEARPGIAKVISFLQVGKVFNLRVRLWLVTFLQKADPASPPSWSGQQIC